MVAENLTAEMLRAGAEFAGDDTSLKGDDPQIAGSVVVKGE